MRWKYRIGAVVGATGLGLAGLVFASGGAHAAVTLTFHEHDTNVEYLINGQHTLNPTSAPGPGDSLIFRGDLSGGVSGASEGQCVVTFNNNLLCNAVFEVPGKGDIFGSALLRGGASGNGPAVFDAAVAGGTFAYRNAHGDAHAVSVNQTDTDWTLNLITQ
jgi:hypothetical protein